MANSQPMSEGTLTTQGKTWLWKFGQTYCNTPGIDLPDDATPLTKQRKVWEKKL
jgi:hypothetical protein